MEPHKKMLLGIQHSVPLGDAVSSICFEAGRGVVEAPDGKQHNFAIGNLFPYRRRT